MKTRILTSIIISIFWGYSSSYANISNPHFQSDSTLIAYLKEYGIQTSKENHIKILKSGEDKFLDLFKEIRKAKHHIHL